MEAKNNFELQTVSPLDGRYSQSIHELSLFFSEKALIKYRLKIEVEYLIALGNEKSVKEFKMLSPRAQEQLRKLYQKFSTDDAVEIKNIEKTTSHDVKAVEYWLRGKLEKLRLSRAIPWVHFALTSEDVNNIAYTLMWRDSIIGAILPVQKKLTRSLRKFARKHRKTALLSLTHGQPASPTTFGKEIAVFVHRIEQQLSIIRDQGFEGKLNGATGVWGAHITAIPTVNWVQFSEKFIRSFGLKPALLTTQILSHDSLAESYHSLARLNTIYRDLCQDIWLYISRGVLSQKRFANEVGSSTMPHKINPIQFENAEGNLGLANSLLIHLSEKLAVSRMQRDLSGSTVIRNQGTASAYALLAYKNILKGFDRLDINREKIAEELDAHWEVLAEPIQTVLRKHGVSDAYEQLKELTRGETVDMDTVRTFIEKLDIPAEDKKRLLDITPSGYTGLAERLTDLI